MPAPKAGMSSLFKPGLVSSLMAPSLTAQIGRPQAMASMMLLGQGGF